MGNLDLWDNVREVPDTAKKEIGAGRLKGKTDINPVWRLKTLTEFFGPCGIGWRYEICGQRLETGGNGEIAAFVDINLYIKNDGAWSDPIPGTGGSMFVANERSGLYTSDECFKMALTDAISVACKALGVAADVYWDKDKTKYTGREPGEKEGPSPNEYKCADCGKEILKYKNLSADDIVTKSMTSFGRKLCYTCSVKAYETANH